MGREGGEQGNTFVVLLDERLVKFLKCENVFILSFTLGGSMHLWNMFFSYVL